MTHDHKHPHDHGDDGAACAAAHGDVLLDQGVRRLVLVFASPVAASSSMWPRLYLGLPTAWSVRPASTSSTGTMDSRYPPVGSCVKAECVG